MNPGKSNSYRDYCSYCKLDKSGGVDLYHCDDCDVCIEDCDHHCVFFSKCIGGGNIACFWGTLIGVMFNFLNIAIMLGVSASKAKYKAGHA